MADIIILNKSDLVEPQFLSDLSQRLKSVNTLAPITATSRAQIPLKNLLGLRGFELEQVEATLESAEKRAKHSHDNPEHVCGPECDHDHEHDHGHHHDGEHSHAHDHTHDHSSSSGSSSSTSDVHSHGHSHAQEHAHAEHSREHGHDHGECGPGCTNPDHDHSHHSHSHAKPLHNDKVCLQVAP